MKKIESQYIVFYFKQLKIDEFLELLIIKAKRNLDHKN
jgi:hypothetical protein